MTILNCVHNHKIMSKLEGHILAGRLIGEDRKLVGNLTKSLVHPKNIQMKLKGKRKVCLTNIKKM